MIYHISQKHCTLRRVCDMLLVIYQGDLLLKLAQVLENCQVCDKDTKRTDWETSCASTRVH